MSPLGEGMPGTFARWSSGRELRKSLTKRGSAITDRASAYRVTSHVVPPSGSSTSRTGAWSRTSPRTAKGSRQ